MIQPKQPSSRRKILLWGAALLSSFTLLKYLPGAKKKHKTPPETIKMLSQDGRLVEIDKTLISSAGKRISNEELQKWIKK